MQYGPFTYRQFLGSHLLGNYSLAWDIIHGWAQLGVRGSCLYAILITNYRPIFGGTLGLDWFALGCTGSGFILYGSGGLYFSVIAKLISLTFRDFKKALKIPIAIVLFYGLFEYTEDRLRCSPVIFVYKYFK